jgi:yecA family protein
VNSLTRRYRIAGSERPDPGELRPPDLRALGAASFSAPQRARLAAWLEEPGWPRDRMDIATLEGYLVALIAWPVAVPSGAWLPPIWGERGWKVPTKIAARSHYDEFVGLIHGFMLDLERRLSRSTARFESSVLRPAHERERANALQAWGKGFMTALTFDSQGLKWRGAGTRAAVHALAAAISAAPATSVSHSVERVVNAVLALLELRTSRGPLGPLESAVRAQPEIEGALSG